MSKEAIEQWTKLSRANLDAYKELGEITTRLYTRLFDQQLDALNVAAEAGVRQVTLLSVPPRSAREFLDKETALVGEANELLLAIARQTSEVLAEAGNDLGAWTEKQIRSAAQEVQQTQNTVRQAAQAAARKAAA